MKANKKRKRKKKRHEIDGKQKLNPANINPILSIITLNVKGLNNHIKRQRLSFWN